MQLEGSEMKREKNAPWQSRASGLARWLVITAIAIVVAAVAVAVFIVGGSGGAGGEGRPVPAPSFETGGAAPAGSAATTARPGDLVVTLAPDVLANSGIKIETAAEAPSESAASSQVLRTTGTVQSNAYNEVPVMSIAGGIVRQVNALLGDKVARGQPLATIFSTDLAEAQTGYLRTLAEVEEHHKHHNRMLELVELGAASREEVEQATSQYKSAKAMLASWRERLLLLGMSAKQIDEMDDTDEIKPMISVASPASGTVLSRTVNPGEVVMANKELFRVADLSNVWVIAQIYERDFAVVGVGIPAAVTTPSYPRRTLSGRVTYIAPRVEPQTRTGEVRVEIANPGEMLKLGMFVDVSFGGAAAAASTRATAALPRSAVQNIGERTVVFIASGQAGVFVQREVEAGPEVGGVVPIFGGVNAGERVVTEGSFLLRAESLKLKPDQLSATNPETHSHPGQAQQREAGVQSLTVLVTDKGFEPAGLKLKLGIPARVTFIRKVDATCATEVSIPDFNIKRELPLNEPVVVEFTPGKPGDISFVCGMGMQRGRFIVK